MSTDRHVVSEAEWIEASRIQLAHEKAYHISIFPQRGVMRMDEGWTECDVTMIMKTESVLR